MPEPLTADANIPTFAQFNQILGELMDNHVPLDSSLCYAVNISGFVAGLSAFINPQGGETTTISGLMMEDGGYVGRVANQMIPIIGSHALPSGTADNDVIGFLVRAMDAVHGIWDTLEVVTNDITKPGERTVTMLMWHDVQLLRNSSIVKITFDKS